MRFGTTLSAAFLVTTTSVAVALSACGGSNPQPAQTPTAATDSSTAPTATDTSSATTTAPTSTDTGAPTATGAPSTAISGPPKPWDSMTKEEKGKYMHETVVPLMKGEFQAFDSNAFATFTCKTCHGSGAKDGSFKMPSADLPQLDMKGQLAKDKAAHPQVFDFMMQKVEPDMASVLGLQKWSPQNQSGFGCFSCHTAAP